MCHTACGTAEIGSHRPASYPAGKGQRKGCGATPRCSNALPELPSVTSLLGAGLDRFQISAPTARKCPPGRVGFSFWCVVDLDPTVTFFRLHCPVVRCVPSRCHTSAVDTHLVHGSEPL